ncbi:MAG: hypothetical protein A2061_11050 [Gallionellales bacterium GWA2_59_43]|nr:MAG: hypothetical protein A2061_11050 [Gallionellales bacterium GWA2_59_43]
MNFLPSNIRNPLNYVIGIVVLFALLLAGVAQALNVSSTTLEVQAGNTASVRITEASGEVRLSSSNTNVATVKYEDGFARIRGRAAGSATITVRDRQSSRQIAVTVTPAPVLTVEPTSVQIQAGNTATVSVTNSVGEVEASTSNTRVATVSYSNGVATIRGRAAGSATVTIKDKRTILRVSVTVTAESALTVSPTTVQVQAGNTATVNVTNANGAVTASSSNTAIATVTYATGVATIRGVAAGTATITIRDSVNTRTVAVTVTAAPVLTVSPTTVQVLAGNTANVTVTNANGAVTVSSSNTAIATVTYATGVATVRGVAVGTATITISDSTNSRTVAVTVTAAPVLTVSPTSAQVQAGNTVTVSVTNANGAVTVASSNTAIATVTYASGVATIRGVAAGTATITISDSVNTSTVAVTVTAAAVLTVSPTTVQVQAGNTATVNVTNANGAVTVASSNTGIATVTYASGVATIRGVAAGTATITIRDSVNTRTVAVTVNAVVAAGNYTLLAWNNLGMHCYDGNDYSIFAILPPLNTVNAQLVNQASGGLVTSGVTLTYQATADTTGSVNSISSTKTNFWDYVQDLFGLAPAPDVGLLGYPMASSTPAPMTYSAEHNWFEAVGIPITNVDDTNRKNDYPMIQVVAKNTAGQVLATTKVVLPVSDSMACRGCHTSNTAGNAAANAARPVAGWVFDPDPLKDWKKNILRLHDEKQAGNPTYANALQAKGYPDGLFNSAVAGKPVLCVACHLSNAYQLEAGVPTGIAGIPPLSRALHGLHANKVDPDNGLTLDSVNNRNTCYHCHPGSDTMCLRGAMSGPDYQCQSCHSKMSHVGSTARNGWLDLPNCQSCHHDGQRETSGVDAQGLPLTWSDTRFATNPDVPSIGARLYRYSTGHGGLKCEACHGSTHAEFPSREANDNVQSIAVQGHAGTVQECVACHATVPTTVNGGPHGMHPIGSQWVSRHRSSVGTAAARAECAYCHGADFRGTPLSRVKVAKTLDSRSFAAGQMVGCYDCHNGPTGAITSATKFAEGENFIDSIGHFFGELAVSVMSYLSEIGSKILPA